MSNESNVAVAEPVNSLGMTEKQTKDTLVKIAQSKPKSVRDKAEKALNGLAAAAKNGKAAAKAKPAAAPAKKAAPTPKTAGSNGSSLRKPQARILLALRKAGKGLTRSQIAEKANVDNAGCVEWVGSADDSIRKANDAKHFPSLVSLGYVKFGNNDGSAAAVYEITAKGRAAAEKLTA